MSERIHIHDNRATIRWKLLTTASAMALTAYVSSTGMARAEDGDRPTLWIELGGQMDSLGGISSPFTAPFMSVTPTPEPYQGDSPTSAQRPPRFAFGAEGKIIFQPEDSDWMLSASIRYGRSHNNRHTHHQTAGLEGVYYTFFYHNVSSTQLISNEAFLDVTAPYKEHHLVLDFAVGKDVGIGLLGRDGSSSFNAGVRFVDLRETSAATIFARPSVGIVYTAPKYVQPFPTFHAYQMTGHAARSFKGVGPSLSWTGSAALAGNRQDGELMVDFGINAALLFGRQKAKTDHSTEAHQLALTYYHYDVKYSTLYPGHSRNNPLRSRDVTVPNVGGSIGLSVKYPNFKFSVGYRADVFLNAMDTGIDALKKSNLSFNGPYASISIGLGD